MTTPLPLTLSYDRAVKKGTESDPNPEILPAEHGHFSTPFFKKTRFALELAPGVVAHIVTMKVASGGAGERVQTTKEAPLPFNEQAWDDANEVYKLLMYWSVAFAGMLKMNPPAPARRAWRASDNRVVGLPANITAQDARYVMGLLTVWMRTQLESIMHLRAEDVTEFHEQILEVFRISARWPQRDRSSWSKLPCPFCGGLLAIYPPEMRGAERTILCQTCENTLTDDEYRAHFERLATGTKIAQQLVIKSGIQIPGEWRL